MSNPIRQHYVPRVYLENFTEDDGYINIFDIEKNEYRRQTPLNIGHNRHFYTVEIDGKKDYSIENFLSKEVDSKYNRVINKIESKEILTTDDKQDLAIILAFQYLRTPAQRENFNNMVDSVYKQTTKILFSYKEKHGLTGELSPEEFKEVKELIDSGNYKVESPKEHSLGSMFNTVEDMAKMLSNHNIAILEAGKNTQFITSDNPYCMVKENWSLPMSGYGVVNTIKFFPLTTKFAVILRDPGSAVIYTKPSKSEIRTMNLLVARWARRFIFSKNKILLESIVNAHKKKVQKNNKSD
ncbi:DUF4238 domain-containing protein [Niallia taxi]|uniref:DUF4238 domain-containing protein n=1 Tax=Niallia taxi TaxID=2499688 RepID=UPI0015F744D0|nr:DUF4238 domain-containing protein [Niallia taxi]